MKKESKTPHTNEKENSLVRELAIKSSHWWVQWQLMWFVRWISLHAFSNFLLHKVIVAGTISFFSIHTTRSLWRNIGLLSSLPSRRESHEPEYRLNLFAYHRLKFLSVDLVSIKPSFDVCVCVCVLTSYGKGWIFPLSRLINLLHIICTTFKPTWSSPHHSSYSSLSRSLPRVTNLFWLIRSL